MMRRVRFAALVLAAFAAVGAGSGAGASALPPLSENSHINDRLLMGLIGNAIRRNCPRIDGNRMRALAELSALQRHAQSLGYSRAEIEAYVRDSEARADMLEQRRDWLEANGAVRGDAESYCRIGEREIARGSYLGSLLRLVR